VTVFSPFSLRKRKIFILEGTAKLLKQVWQKLDCVIY
jgi:hypothetical protein